VKRMYVPHDTKCQRAQRQPFRERMVDPRPGRDDLLDSPPGDRLVWHAPHRGSAHNYYLSAGPCPAACGLERVMNWSRNGLGMRETEIARETS
jgi:hypothetical protein